MGYSKENVLRMSCKSRKSQFSNVSVLINNLAWNPPKVKKEAWINLYKENNLHNTP